MYLAMSAPNDVDVAFVVVVRQTFVVVEIVLKSWRVVGLGSPNR